MALAAYDGYCRGYVSFAHFMLYLCVLFRPPCPFTTLRVKLHMCFGYTGLLKIDIQIFCKGLVLSEVFLIKVGEKFIFRSVYLHVGIQQYG